MKCATGILVRAVAALALLVNAAAALAQWELDGTKSTLNFISIKNDAVAEVHSFGSLMGYISSEGKAQLTIDLGSVETMVDIRNERMREMLFETVKFPTATVSAQVDPAVIAAAKDASVATELTFTLDLHGLEKSITAPVVLVGEPGGRLQVFTASPIVVNAADFGLEAGVAVLQEVAGLKAISTAVPVTVHLVFKRAK